MDYPFWVNNFDRVKDHRLAYPSVAKIFEQPVSFWYGDRQGKYTCNIDDGLGRLMKRVDPQLPVLVIYNIPERDVGHHSKGGAKTREAYIEFLHAFCRGIGDRAPIVIFEPDAVPHSTLMDKSIAESRLSLLKEGLDVLTSNSNALVYVDVGHSNWLAPAEVAKLLDVVSNDKVKGFSVNVSNFRSTKESMTWALAVCEQRTQDTFVIDTSRNGNGPHGNDWCNPPGRCLGTPPTTDTGEDKCDAFLWIKIPGESDGKCNGGPRAGLFWPEYADKLVKNTPWIY
jgi:endoglucanase